MMPILKHNKNKSPTTKSHNVSASNIDLKKIRDANSGTATNNS